MLIQVRQLLQPLIHRVAALHGFSSRLVLDHQTEEILLWPHLNNETKISKKNPK